MDLPRIASQTSIPTNIELLNYNQQDVNTRRRVVLSTAIRANDNQSSNTTPPQFFSLRATGSSLVPSRKREERLALENLNRKTDQLIQMKEIFKPVLSIPSINIEDNQIIDNQKEEQKETEPLDNRPQLFQKIIQSRPLSVVVDISELRTAWQDSEFISECLCWHNVYRGRHGSPPLHMCPALCQLAQQWANHLAHTNMFRYRTEKDLEYPKVGQNLYCRPASLRDVTGQEVASYWYAAVRMYDYGKEPDVLHVNVNAGHFTQLVWAASRKLGVGKALSRSGKVIVVANYAPPGNTSGAFQENVLPPQPDVQLPPPPTYRPASRSSVLTEMPGNASDIAARSDTESTCSSSTR